MMENPGGNWPEEQPVKPRSAWPVVVGVVAVIVILLAALGVSAWRLGWLPESGLFSRWSKPEVIDLNPSTSSNETISKQYRWSYDGNPVELNLAIPKDIYDYYHKMERAPIEDYSIYVTHPYDDSKLVNPLAAELKKLAVQKGYDAEGTVNFTASFVQNLKYEEDANGEYPNYPVETLYDKKGDCEDMSILTAALLQSMGYDAVLIRYSPATGSGHMAVGVALTAVPGEGDSYTYEGKKYYYLETTSEWPLGGMPDKVFDKYKGESDAIYKLVQAPALRFSGKLEYSAGTKTVDISVTVTNWGTADAKGFRVRAYFEGRESDAKSSATYDLAYGHRISGVVTKGIAKPSGGSTLQVELWEGGKVVDEWAVDF